MHQGEDKEFYLQKGFNVIAFEADPDWVRACRHRLNEFIAQGQLTIIEGAILDLDTIDAGRKKVQFYKNDKATAWGTVRVDWAERSAIPSSQSPPYPPTEGEYVAQCFAEGSSGLFGCELGGKWKSKNEILCQYRAVWLGYYLLGDDGIMKTAEVSRRSEATKVGH
jgi:hypothetical protein